MTKLINANALQIPLADQSVHMVVTSPPYWALRDYGVGGQLGLEATPELYVENMVQVFREVWRVLRDDGVLYLNIGDSYASAWACNRRNVVGNEAPPIDERVNKLTGVLKEKDLVGIPWRLAFALQADGWYLRSDIIWHKPNPMPESVTDRPTKSHEYIFLLSKSQRYFYDQEAVREAASYDGRNDTMMKGSDKYDTPVMPGQTAHTMALRGHECWPTMTEDGKPGRNQRDVWTIATQPYPGSHFATFPEKLVEPCIKAGTSEKGCCPHCGKQWERVVEATKYTFRPTCSCPEHEPIPSTVFDPFAGSGTVGRVAARLGRSFVGVELSLEYIGLAEKRMSEVQIVMPI